ncbi:MAG: hypothetical protein JWP37_3877 [Mucilaginibacter sp.]|nr:hypothetical protein [Mucilaginibacter sp.]
MGKLFTLKLATKHAGHKPGTLAAAMAMRENDPLGYFANRLPSLRTTRQEPCADENSLRHLGGYWFRRMLSTVA